MATKIVGISSPQLSVDEERNREYSIRYLIKGNPNTDGPATVVTTPGLPVIGTTWAFKSEVDLYATLHPDCKVVPVLTDEPSKYWYLDLKYSTKPVKKCQTSQFQTPLDEPQEVGGGFTKYTEEITEDRFGEKIFNSAWEVMRGPQVEFDKNRPNVKIKQNVLSLQYTLLCQMVDTLNNDVLWGFSRGAVKLSSVSWAKKWYGTCYPYYERNFEFDINEEKGWDRDIVDEGTKVLKGKWNSEGKWELTKVGVDPMTSLDIMPNPDNPQHFIRYQDRQGNTGKVVLKNGKPWDPDATDDPTYWCLLDRPGTPGYSCFNGTCAAAFALGASAVYGPYDNATFCGLFCMPGLGSGQLADARECDPKSPGQIHIEYYDESDFLLLGIPTSF
jgi:hypothetical protein